MRVPFFCVLLVALSVLAVVAPAVAAAQFIDDDWRDGIPMPAAPDRNAGRPIVVPVDGPVIVPPRPDAPWVLHAERHEDGQWYLLMAPRTTLDEVFERTAMYTRLQVSPHDRNPRTREVISLLLSQLGGLFLETGGVRRGDVLRAINGTPVASLPAIREWARANPRPESITLDLLRDGEPKPLTVHLSWMPTRNGLDISTAEGQTLEAVATEFYGNPRFYRLLATTNELPDGQTANDPLPPGTTLHLPHHPAIRYPAEPTADGRWLIPAYEHTSASENFATLVRLLRPAPAALEDGRQGLRLTGVSRQALPYRRGLMRGDLILSSNGVAMDSGDSLLEFYNSHRDYRFFDVQVSRRGEDLVCRYCLLPSLASNEADLQPPAISATPAEFGCTRDAAADAALSAEAGCRAMVWNVTRAQTHFLSRSYREIFREMHLLPLLTAPDEGDGPASGDDDNRLRYAGLSVRYCDPGTLPHAYGIRADDVIDAVRIDGGDWNPVRAAWQLVALFPLDLSADTIDFRIVRAGSPMIIRAVLVPTPQGIEELPLVDGHGLPVQPAARDNDNDNGSDSPPDDDDSDSHSDGGN